MAAGGKDVSKYLAQKVSAGQPLEKAPIQRVNVDFNLAMLKELDALVKELNLSRQAVINVYLSQAFDQHLIARQVTH